MKNKIDLNDPDVRKKFDITKKAQEKNEKLKKINTEVGQLFVK